MMMSEILRAAHATLLERGWCQGKFEDWHGRVCLVGAIRYGARSFCFPLEVCAVLMHVTGSDHIAQWNDVPGRTLTEVLAALESAWVIAEDQELRAALAAFKGAWLSTDQPTAEALVSTV